MSNSSNNTNYKQVANVERRTWNAETYEKKAQARQHQQQQQSSDGNSHKMPTFSTRNNKNNNTAHDYDNQNQNHNNALLQEEEKEKPEFRAAPVGAAGPEGSQRAFLQARIGRVQGIDDRVGHSTLISVEQAASSAGVDPSSSSSSLVVQKIVDSDATPTLVSLKASSSSSISNGVQKTGVGWHCTVCDCFLKDSLTYLDHINGRKHQRHLGFSMRVERSTATHLADKLQELQKQQQQQQQNNNSSTQQSMNGTDITAKSWNELVQEKDELEQILREERQRKRKERKKLQKDTDREQSNGFEDTKVDHRTSTTIKEETEPIGQEDLEHEEEEVDGMDPAMAAMMGFSGFGGSNKRT